VRSALFQKLKRSFLLLTYPLVLPPLLWGLRRGSLGLSPINQRIEFILVEGHTEQRDVLVIVFSVVIVPIFNARREGARTPKCFGWRGFPELSWDIRPRTHHCAFDLVQGRFIGEFSYYVGVIVAEGAASSADL
jgi:hypothetical protein